MKKASVILLIPLFVLSTAGLSITSLYCQGELCEIGFTVHPCCDDVNKGGCCETQSTLLKIQDGFVKAANDIPVKVCSFERLSIDSTLFPELFTTRSVVKFHIRDDNVAVADSGPGVYLRLCTLLI